jgi:hypothetical protein
MRKKSVINFFIFLIFLLGLGMFSYSMRPQCSLIADEALEHFGIPIDQRQDRDFYLKVFQHKSDGHWYECKTALTQAGFF